MGYNRAIIMIQKEQAPHNLDGLLYFLVGGIIKETLRYRSYIVLVLVGATLPQVSELSDSGQPEILFRIYGGWEGTCRSLGDRICQTRVRHLLPFSSPYTPWINVVLLFLHQYCYR